VGGGKAIDLVATRAGKRTAFEIGTGKSDAAANVRKCLDAGADRVVVVATSELIRNRVAGELPKDEHVVCVTAAETIRQADELLADSAQE
jgi:hypothetical protein